VVNTLPGNPPQRADNLQPVKYVGTGFMCIRRDVFEKMATAYPEIRYREDYGGRGIAHDFWSMAPYGPGSAEGRVSRLRALMIEREESGKTNAETADQFHAAVDNILNGQCESESRYLSEDWFFCQRWLDMGGEIFADCRVILRHIGTSIFPLRTQEDEINNPQIPEPKAAQVQPVNLATNANVEWSPTDVPE